MWLARGHAHSNLSPASFSRQVTQVDQLPEKSSSWRKPGFFDRHELVLLESTLVRVLSLTSGGFTFTSAAPGSFFCFLTSPCARSEESPRPKKASEKGHRLRTIKPGRPTASHRSPVPSECRATRSGDALGVRADWWRSRTTRWDQSPQPATKTPRCPPRKRPQQLRGRRPCLD